MKKIAVLIVLWSILTLLIAPDTTSVLATPNSIAVTSHPDHHQPAI